MGTGNTLINRSSRFGSGSTPTNNGTPESDDMIKNGKSIPLRRPHDGTPNNYRTAYHVSSDDGDDNITVKSNSGLAQPSPQHGYILPCFRLIRNKRTATLIFVASVIFVSIQIIAYRSLSSIPLSDEGFFLPKPKRWGADRERRRIERHEGRRGKSHRPSIPTAEREVQAVKYTEYESSLLNFLFSLRAAGMKASVLPLKNYHPLGQDMGIYSRLGCSVFNQLNNSSNNNNQNSTTFHKDRIRHLWSSHLSTILQASRHADDAEYTHKDWTATLLKSLSPYSILDHLPSNNNSMNNKDIERIIGILIRRLLGLFQSSGLAYANMPPPLRIAVFGGPTVEGIGCNRARVEIPRGSMANPAFCSFPHRLEHFLNEILLPQPVLKQLRKTLSRQSGSAAADSSVSEEAIRLVEVINLGEEGTNSDYSTAIVRNRMFPPLQFNPKGKSSSIGYGGGPPDVVIDAYGIDEYGRDTTELHSFDDVVIGHFDSNRKECLAENQRPPAVIIRVVLEEDATSEDQFVSAIMTAVLGDVIDDVEEGEMSLPDIQKNFESKEIGAFGMAGHVASSWTLAFNLAYAAFSHCGSIAHQPPQPPPKKYAIQNAIHNAFVSPHCDNGIDPPCIFSFLAGPKGTAQRPSAIASTLMPFMVDNTGWQPESDISTGFARKTGLVGTGAGASMTLLFLNITRPVRRFDVISLRSTSEAWKDGVAQFIIVTGGDFSHDSDEAREANAKNAQETSFELSAELIADKTNDGDDKHISYHFGLDLPEGSYENPGHLGTDVLVRIILTKGIRFKILGLMLCE